MAESEEAEQEAAAGRATPLGALRMDVRPGLCAEPIAAGAAGLFCALSGGGAAARRHRPRCRSGGRGLRSGGAAGRVARFHPGGAPHLRRGAGDLRRAGLPGAARCATGAQGPAVSQRPAARAAAAVVALAVCRPAGARRRAHRGGASQGQSEQRRDTGAVGGSARPQLNARECFRSMEGRLPAEPGAGS